MRRKRIKPWVRLEDLKRVVERDVDKVDFEKLLPFGGGKKCLSILKDHEERIKRLERKVIA